MKKNKKEDEFLLGKKIRIIKQKQVGFSFPNSGKKSSGSTKNQMIINAALKYPEVMVKIPKRYGSSNGLNGIGNNLDYISRNGSLELENQDGDRFLGKDENQNILNEYRAIGIPNESHRKEALNVVLSMPPETDPVALKDAVREFAKETFPENHWVMVLHTDTDHPHCHLNVLLKNQQGKRINTSPYELQKWRERFAEKMMEQGVLCTATRRKQRGKYTKSQNNTLRHMKQRGAKLFVEQKQIKEIVDALAEHKRPNNPHLQQILVSKNIIEEQYATLSRALYHQGYKNEAKLIAQLRKSLTSADTRSQTQKKFDAVNREQSQAMPTWLDNSKTTETTIQHNHTNHLKR